MWFKYKDHTLVQLVPLRRDSVILLSFFLLSGNVILSYGMTTKETAYKQIEDLVQRFGEQIDSYKKTDYNETLVRRDFIDPFFKALGWDMDNSQGYAEAYREVIHEDKLKIGSATKAPDYSFRLAGGKRLFFVEAKKPSVFVKNEIPPAYQLRRYAWSAKMPVSILTDFEEFAIYDCNKKPKPDDKASVGRIEYFTYKDYLDKFDFFWDTFSKERVLKGSFDKFVASDKNKKGTTTVDKEFLTSLDEWRKHIAQNVALRNESFSEDDLNFTVQQTLDRIIFLRIAEARGVEEYGRLQKLLKGDNYYQNLFAYFKEADSKYNSGLFDFKKDKISKGVIIDDKVIKTIITELYYPVSPYEFSVLSVEILGSAYEQFLGKQIKLTAGHRATIEEKPEVRKAGGVYYTPQYIVEYIVQNTIGKLIGSPLGSPEPVRTGVGGKKPADIAKLRIVDPACGSGSFLLGAYQYLLNWHRNFYEPEFNRLTEISTSKDFVTKERNDAIKERNKLPLTPDGNLTTALKKQILLNNIYGVDIDLQAVEVTKLSLLLKCMEGETGSSINAEMRFGERVLPTLENNIKCGNSLISDDIYDTQLDLGYEKKVRPFNWQKAFPEVFQKRKPGKNLELKHHFNKVKKLEEEADKLIEKINNIFEEPQPVYGKQSGFDIVIGNPPYGAAFIDDELDYFKSHYQTSVLRSESYLLFIEQGLKLLHIDGVLGFIIPDTLLNLGFTHSIREYLLRNSKLIEVVSLPSNVFHGATVDTVLLFTEKKDRVNTFHASNIEVKGFNKKKNITSISDPDKLLISKATDWHLQNSFNVHVDSSDQTLIEKLEKNGKTISDIADMFSGIKSYEVGKGSPAQTEKIRDTKPFTSLKKEGKEWKPFYDGKHIGRYQLLWKNNNWIHYGVWLAAPRDPENFSGEKILIRKIIGKTLIATYVPETSYCNTLLFVLKLKDKSYSYKSILAILNSSLFGWYFRKKFQITDEDTFPQIMIRDVLQFPIPLLIKKKGGELATLTETMLQLQQQKQQITLPNRIEQSDQRIAHTDNAINQKVYQLYGLTEEEIKIVEGK
jgi:type I restriction-modification system DNA methylase subunit